MTDQAAGWMRRALLVIAVVAGVVMASTPMTAWATAEGVDLALSASSLPGGASTLTVTNVGTEPALGAELRGTFVMEGDSSWTLTPASTSPCTTSGYLEGEVTCPLGDIAVGAAVVIVAELQPCATLTLVLAAVAAGDVDPTNDAAQVVLNELCTEAPPENDECGDADGPACDVCFGDPEVFAGDDLVVDEGAFVVLAGSIFEGCIPVVSSGWSQPSAGDPPITLTQYYAGATFTAPAVDVDTLLTFRLTAASERGQPVSDDVTVTVRNVRSPLVLTADDHVVQYGDALPLFTVTPSGLVGSDTLTALSGTLTCTTPAVAGSPPGSYPISCEGLSSPDYVVSYLPGQLTVTAEDVVVRLAQSNPHAVAVRMAGGTAPAMTFAARITEAADGSYGGVSDLAAASAFRLVPLSGGNAPAPCAATAQRVVVATATQPGYADVSCTFPAGTRVDVYDVLVDVDGQQHRGRTHGVLTVFDPSAGGTRGAGLVSNPAAPGSVGEFAFIAKRLKNGAVQGRFLYVQTTSSGAQSIVKGNEMATLAVKGNTASITGKASVDGIGNNRYVLTVTDGAPDLYGQRISSPAGVANEAFSFAGATVTSGAVSVGT